MSKRRLVAVTATCAMPVRLDLMESVLGEEFEVKAIPLPFGELSAAELEPYWSEIAQADALFVRTGLVPEALIKRSSKLRVISLHGVGVDQVDVKAAAKAGITVTNVPGGNANSVAELTVGLMIALLRHVTLADRRLRTGDWEGARVMGLELQGRTVGLVGYGSIGRRVAELLHPFGTELLYYDRQAAMIETSQAKQVSLQALLEQSDIVSIHVPFTPETHHLFSRSALQAMKSGSFLINTARGPIVDQEALYDALTTGHLAGAALDVFDPEPLPPNSPLLKLDNIVVTPHIGGSTEECLARLAERAAADIRAVLENRAPRYPVE